MTSITVSSYSSTWSRLLYDSPLHQLRGKLLFALAVIIAVGFAVPIWVGWLTPLSSGLVLLYAFAMACVGSMFGLMFLRYLHRRHPAPWSLSFTMFFASALLAPSSAAWFNTHSPAVTLTVGFVEEFWKVYPLLLLVFFIPRAICGVRDGLVYGALGGLGFNVIETAVYVLRMSLPEHGLIEGTTAQLSRLGWWGIGNHVIWSALVGAGIGWAVQNPRSPRRLLVPIGAYGLASFTHLLQDNVVGIILTVGISVGLLSLAGMDPNHPPKDPVAQQHFNEAAAQFAPTAMALEAVFINIVNLPILFMALWRSGKWERAVIGQQLAAEPPDIVTPEEMQGIEADKRLRNRKIPGVPKAVARLLRNAQNSLAFHKRYLSDRGRSSDTDPLAAYWREEIRRLRSL